MKGCGYRSLLPLCNVIEFQSFFATIMQSSAVTSNLEMFLMGHAFNVSLAFLEGPFINMTCTVHSLHESSERCEDNYIKMWFELTFSVCRLLPLYFPRNKYEEETAATKLPVDVGDENGETVISERKIRIAALPGTTAAPLMATPQTSGNISLTDHSPSMKRWGCWLLVSHNDVAH